MTCAIYFDGQSARMHRVELDTAGNAVVVAGPGIARVYTAAEARLAEPFRDAPTVLYFSDGARCEVSGPDCAGLAQALGYRRSRVVHWQAHWPAALAALALLVALIGAAAIWGIPAAAEAIAQRLPPALDTSLGKSMLDGLEKQKILEPTRLSEQRIAELGQMLGKVTPAHPRLPLRLAVRNSEQLGANALALPDGTIVVTDQLVRAILAKSQDFSDTGIAMLTGVLAHEVGHIERRHSARVLARTSLTAALSATMFGDFSAVAAGVPAVLMNMSYSREMESEADEYAIQALRAKKIKLEPLASLFAALDEANEAERNVPRWLSRSMEYAASHPSTSERIKRLRAAARQDK
jgi:Zn-dependent protease with chaperone function